MKDIKLEHTLTIEGAFTTMGQQATLQPRLANSDEEQRASLL